MLFHASLRQVTSLNLDLLRGECPALVSRALKTFRLFFFPRAVAAGPDPNCHLAHPSAKPTLRGLWPHVLRLLGPVGHAPRGHPHTF